MDKYNIYGRLENDILNSKNLTAYYINQNNKINQINSGKKPDRDWKYYIDGYAVCARGDAFYGHYRYDKKKDRCNPLTFRSYNKHSGLDFLKFINRILSGDESIFLQMKGLEVLDLRKSLFKIKELEIHNTEVDNFFIYMINRYFPNLESIKFRYCIIKKECDFSKIKSTILLDESAIEDFRVFNDTSADIKLSRTNINKISCTRVNSKGISFESINNLYYRQLFLKCNFPHLENLTIYPDADKIALCCKGEFKFLSKSAPNLENFSIQGKLDSFDFLMQLSNLLRCDIKSISDDHGSFYPDVITKRERLKLKKRNIELYEIRKILFPDEEDQYIIGSLELQRILKLAHFNKLIEYTEEEKILKDSPIEYVLNQNKDDKEVIKFYESYYDTLLLRNTENEKDIRLGISHTYYLKNGFMYADYNREKVYTPKDKIVFSKKFIYNFDGKPIIFMNRKKQIRTMSEALEFRRKHEYKECMGRFNEEDLNYNKKNFLEWLRELYKEDEEIDVGSLIDIAEEQFDYIIQTQDFKDLGEGGRFITGSLEKCDRINKRFKDIHNKNLYFRDLINKLIVENYDKFTISEKVVLFFDSKKYWIRKKEASMYRDFFGIEKDYNEDLIKNIDVKTGNLYSKYMKMLRVTYIQSSMLESGYRIPVKREYIQKLDLKKIKV